MHVITIAQVEKSNMTIIFLLLIRSAIIPPIGDSIIIVMNDSADTIPNSDGEFVLFRRYRGSAYLKIAFPNKD